MKEAETMENQKKLLFLGGTGAMYDAVERAKRMGIYTIVVDYYPNSPAKRIADRSYLASTTDIDRVLDQLQIFPFQVTIQMELRHHRDPIFSAGLFEQQFVGGYIDLLFRCIKRKSKRIRHQACRHQVRIRKSSKHTVYLIFPCNFQHPINICRAGQI